MNTGANTGVVRLKRLNRLLMGGLVAGSLGLVSAAQPPDSRGDAGNLGSGSAQTAPYDTARGSSPPTSGGPMMDTSMAGTVSDAAGNLPPNVTPGWKIRVCSERTKVDNITFRISQPEKSDRSGKASGKPYGSKTTADQAQAREGATQEGTAGQGTAGMTDTASMVQQTAIWSRGSASEIALPTGFREADRIRIEAIGQKNQDAHVCVLYDDHVARKLTFEDREVATLRKTETGECGC